MADLSSGATQIWERNKISFPGANIILMPECHEIEIPRQILFPKRHDVADEDWGNLMMRRKDVEDLG